MHLIKGRHYAHQASRPARARTRSSPRCEYLEPRCLLSTAAPENLSNIMATPSAVLYAPGQIRTAYRVNSIPGQDQGAGETIAIVDAYNDPKIVSDLATADALCQHPGSSELHHHQPERRNVAPAQGKYRLGCRDLPRR